MANCWKTERQERPTFSQLEETIREHMESSVSSYYSNLDVPYEKLNEDRMSSNKHLGLAKLLNDEPKPENQVAYNSY